MLVYHAFADINHGVFRTILLHNHVFGSTVEFDYWRILDFLYLFPHKVKDISVPRVLVKQRNVIARQYNKYNDISSPREFMSGTVSIYSSIAAILDAKGVIATKSLQAGIIEWQASNLPSDVQDLCSRRAEDDDNLLQFLSALRENVPATGPEGIKARTGWIEHRYDA